MGMHNPPVCVCFGGMCWRQFCPSKNRTQQQETTVEAPACEVAAPATPRAGRKEGYMLNGEFVEVTAPPIQVWRSPDLTDDK